MNELDLQIRTEARRQSLLGKISHYNDVAGKATEVAGLLKTEYKLLMHSPQTYFENEQQALVNEKKES